MRGKGPHFSLFSGTEEQCDLTSLQIIFCLHDCWQLGEKQGSGSPVSMSGPTLYGQCRWHVIWQVYLSAVKKKISP